MILSPASTLLGVVPKRVALTVAVRVREKVRPGQVTGFGIPEADEVGDGRHGC